MQVDKWSSAKTTSAGQNLVMMQCETRGESYLSDVLVPVAETEQQVREDVDHIRLKQLPQHVTQHLKREQSTCETENEELSMHLTFDFML